MPTPIPIQVLPGDTAHGGAAGGVCEMPVQTRLKRVGRPWPDDMVIGPESGLPLFEGREDESLVCPGCGMDVTSGVSAMTLHALFQPPGRLLFHCKCDAYGEIDSAGSPTH